MDIFKLRQGVPGSTKLSQTNFHLATSKTYPWYQERSGKIRHYAVCPECENPLNIVNLDIINRVDSQGRALPLYAKHAITSVDGIAEYDEEAYKECSLSNPKGFNGEEGKRTPGKVSSGIIQELLQNADAVHYMIEHFLKLGITDELFQSLLKNFKKQDGHLYRAVTTSNLPYALLYMGGNQSTFRCKVREGSPFQEALTKSQYFVLRGAEIGYSDAARSLPKKPRLRFFFTDHRIKKTETDFEQTMLLVIEEEANDKKSTIFTKHLPLAIGYYRNLVDKRARLRHSARSTFA